MKTIRQLLDIYESAYRAEGNDYDLSHPVGIQAVADAVAPRWISVEDGLPDDNWKTDLLLITTGNDQVVGTYSDSCFRDSREMTSLKITHWMPLLDAPKDSTNLT